MARSVARSNKENGRNRIKLPHDIRSGNSGWHDTRIRTVAHGLKNRWGAGYLLLWLGGGEPSKRPLRKQKNAG